MGIGARGAKMSAGGAGANPPGLAVLLGFRTSTYLLLAPEKKENTGVNADLRHFYYLLDHFSTTFDSTLKKDSTYDK